MRKMIIQKTAGSLLLAAGMIAAPLASAGTLTYQGVTFTFTDAANVLTLEIDAAGRNGDWATASTIGALQVQSVGGSWTDVALSGEAGPPDTTMASNWGKYIDAELNANSCGNGNGSHAACFMAHSTGELISLDDHMVFHFTFTGPTNFSDPSLKLQFYGDAMDKKVGSLLSVNIPAVPEPESYGMFLMGLGILAFLARPRKA